MNKIKWAHFALLLVNVLYGANYIIAKTATPVPIAPFAFIILQVVFAALFFYTIHAIWIKEKVAKKDIPKIVACSLFGVIINQLLFFKGLSLTSAINASIIMIIVPILVLIMATIAIGEKISLRKSIGIGMGAIGALLIIVLGSKFSQQSSFLGDLFILLNAFSYAFYLVLVKPLMAKYQPFTIMKWLFSLAVIPVILVGFDEFSLIDWTGLEYSTWLAIIYVIVGATMATYGLNITALKYVNASVVGIYIYSQPLIASIISIGLGKDELDLVKILAACLIFLGVYLVSFGSKKPTSTISLGNDL